MRDRPDGRFMTLCDGCGNPIIFLRRLYGEGPMDLIGPYGSIVGYQGRLNSRYEREGEGDYCPVCFVAIPAGKALEVDPVHS